MNSPKSTRSNGTNPSEDETSDQEEVSAVKENVISSALAFKDAERKTRAIQKVKNHYKSIILNALIEEDKEELVLGDFVAKLVKKKPSSLSKKSIESISWLDESIKKRILEEMDGHPGFKSMTIVPKKPQKRRHRKITTKEIEEASALL